MKLKNKKTKIGIFKKNSVGDIIFEFIFEILKHI